MVHLRTRAKVAHRLLQLRGTSLGSSTWWDLEHYESTSKTMVPTPMKAQLRDYDGESWMELALSCSLKVDSSHLLITLMSNGSCDYYDETSSTFVMDETSSSSHRFDEYLFLCLIALGLPQLVITTDETSSSWLCFG